MSAQDRAEFVEAASQLIDQDKPVEQMNPLDSLGGALLSEFRQAELDRRETETRWLHDLRQYRGKYEPDELALIGKDRSRTFVRKTRVKVKTVDSRMQDLVFPAGSNKNWDISPTPKPSLSVDQRTQIRAQLQKLAAGKPITRDLFDQAVLEWAKTRSKAMSKTIDDQLTEAHYKQVCLKAIHSGNLYGTGIVKGPLVERKIRTRFMRQGGKWTPQSESYVVPFVDYVPVWRFYPDMAATELEKCRYAYERHLMTKSEMQALADRRSFKRQCIVDYVLQNPRGMVENRAFDNELRDIGERASSMGDVAGRYEVLERWGYLDGQQLRDAGIDVPEDRLHESFFSNVWLLPNAQVIKAVLQPINGVTWPYHIYYFDKDESSIFGEGLAAIMRDDQSSLNSATRLIQDNAAVTSGAQLEITPHLLSAQEQVEEVTPWKIWKRNTISPGVRAINAIELPSRMAELSGMVTMFENNADEVTAIPRYMSGENATSGAAGTSSGLSMLIGNVNIVIKDLIASWDEGVTTSFIEGLYFWNMQFNPDDAIKGDFDVTARGSASLVAREVRSRSLNEFAQLTANPVDAPYVKRDVMLRQMAEANELNDVVKTEDEVLADQGSDAAKQAQQLQMQIQQLQLQEAQAKVSKMLADADLAKTKAQEVLANIEWIVAKAVSTKVEAAYAALEAGGVATSSPHIAPAGDEILRSAGWKDATPNPSIAMLNGPPVQPDQGTTQVLNKGQSFAVEPRGGANTGATGDGTNVDQPNINMPKPGQVPNLDIPTGMDGRRQGIETPRIDG